MRKSRSLLALAIATLAPLVAIPVLAQQPAAPILPRPADAGADARVAGDAGRRDAAGHPGLDAAPHPGPVQGNEPLPPGHPTMPAAEDDDPHPGQPHEGQPQDPHQGMSGMFRAPEDTVVEDAQLPAGSIAIDILDAENKAVSGIDVTLGILQQSVAKGESRKHVNQRTSESGAVRFDALETGSGIAYRISVPKDGATFAAAPFQLPQTKGMRVKLHVYPATSDLEQALVVMQTSVYVELRDDRIQLEQGINVYNFGKFAWVPNDVVLSLPSDFTALTSQQSMSDQGVDAVDKRGARMRGTFGPGQHQLIFRWQVPYAGASSADIRIGLPPHLAAARVMAAASQDMQFQVEGFPPAMPNTDMQGGRLLETQKEQTRGEGGLRDLHIMLRDIPTAGPARIVATGLAALGVLVGLAYAYTARGTRRTIPKGDIKRARQHLLFELEELERAHRAGDVGPKTYERTRREIIDAIARTLAS